MANTGYLQASIAFKTARPSGAPLDINGKLTSVSGRRQAIFLLVGYANPNPALYEVEAYFNANGVIAGNPTTEYNPDACPSGLIYVTPDRLIMAPDGMKQFIKLYSSGPWVFVSGPAIGTLNQTSGGIGFSYLELTPNGTEGQGAFIFRNTVTGATAQVYVISVANPNLWILETGEWNMLGFWFDNGLWHY